MGGQWEVDGLPMHTVAAGLEALVGTWWTNSCLGCMNGFRNATLTLYRAHFWQEMLFGFNTPIGWGVQMNIPAKTD